MEIIKELTKDGDYRITVIHGNAPQKAADLRQLLMESGVTAEIPIETLVVSLGPTLEKVVSPELYTNRLNCSYRLCILAIEHGLPAS